jgi:hypothetical protein
VVEAVMEVIKVVEGVEVVMEEVVAVPADIKVCSPWYVYMGRKVVLVTLLVELSQDSTTLLSSCDT